LIFGVEGGAPQSPDEAASEADALASTGVTHVSAYGLTIEPGTQFGELARRGRLPIASDDVIADSFAAVESALEARGFKHYEISNYARPGDESRHNLGYWRGLDYLGLGCGAVGMHTRPGGACLRYRNHPAPERWMEALESGRLSVIEEEALTPIERLRERIMTGLRLDEGIELERVGSELGVDPFGGGRATAIERLLARGRLEQSGGRLRVPRGARAFADGTAAELF
jgi:oxygen-independent coproporphyrinogen-3 oxidase